MLALNGMFSKKSHFTYGLKAEKHIGPPNCYSAACILRSVVISPTCKVEKPEFIYNEAGNCLDILLSFRMGHFIDNVQNFFVACYRLWGRAQKTMKNTIQTLSRFKDKGILRKFVSWPSSCNNFVSWRKKSIPFVLE